MRSNLFHPILLALFSLSYSPANVRADGGVIRLRDTRGPFVITIFTSGDPFLDCPLDVSVLVQGRKSGNPLLDADVRFTLSPPDVAGKQSDEICGLLAAATPLQARTDHRASVRATRAQASNKLLYAAPVKLDAPGDWKLHVVVTRGADTARFDCLLPVTSRSGKLTGLLPYLLLPPLAVALFAANQGLRRQSLRKHATQSNVH